MATGFITKKGKIYYGVFPWQGKNKWEKLSSNRKDSERMFSEIMRDVHAGTYQQLKEITCNKLIDEWIRSSELRLKGSTIHGYRSIAKHLSDYFDQIPATHIRPSDIEEYLQDKVKEGALSNKTIGYHLGALKSIFKQAIIWGYLSENPAQHIKRPRAEEKEIEFLTASELNDLLDACPDYYYPFVFTAANTGMRWSEITELRWGDFDPLNSTLSITRTTYKGNQQTPKTRSSKRKVLLTDDLTNMLFELKCYIDPRNDDLLFTNTAGNHLNPSNFYRDVFDKMLEQTKVAPITFHGLRHTYATILLSEGAPIVFVQKQLGHSDIQITLKHYGHFLPEDGRTYMQKLQSIIKNRNIIENIKEESTGQ